jgi:4-hydroxy-3-methylbut-2-enyl diphosphate reductase
MVKKILLANPRGFCAGVERAINVVKKALEIYGKPIYIRHQIVHNEYVVKSLANKGAITVEELNEVPEGGVVVFSAHGVAPSVKTEAKELRLKTIDATCPLVAKVHLEAQRFAKEGYYIILIGHKGHQEVIGTMGYAEMELVGSVEDVAQLKKVDKIAYLTQTTLSVDDTKEIIDALKKKMPHIVSPAKEDICYATQNRQNVVKELAKEADVILVVGSETSSNSKRLVETAKKCGVKSYLVPDKSDVKKEELSGVIGITSGASVPEIIVKEVADYLDVPVENKGFVKEDIHFRLPKELS